ncbi:MAG: FMN-binding protein [Treponema sp.]|nr:FMN-binding protein [Candidatus Treponema caballi]
MKKQKKAKLVLMLCLIAVVFSGCSSIAKSAIAKLHNETIDMSRVKDGTWKGSSETGPVSVDVEVTVKASKIERVVLLRHDCGLGHKADVIVDDMKSGNTWDVDIVSGATVSSEVIKNAVNKALRSAMN